MKQYHRLIIWGMAHDADVRKAFMAVFGKPMLQKTPLQNRLDGRFMVGTSMFTEDREKQMNALIKGKGKIVKKQPILWWSIK